MNEEYIRLRKDAIDLGKLSSHEKEVALVAFAQLIEDLHRYKGKTKLKWKLEEGLRVGQYSFGQFEKDFLWAPLGQGIFSGVPQTVHQLYSHLFIQYPSLGKEINSDEWDSLTQCKADYGLLSPGESGLWLTKEEEWQEKRVDHYTSHQDQIFWDVGESFLPNKGWSDRILEQICKSENVNFSEANFHEMLGRQGPNKEACIRKWGKRICCANFYIYNRELSNRESRESKGEKRVIYYIERNGRMQYISLDLAHGMLELYDNHGNHLGEYRFSGTKNKDPNPSHNLKTLR